MILLDKSLVEGLDPEQPSLDNVKTALQRAIELEHATIPVYLYGLYSLIPGKNDAIAAIIDSVVIEEMLHMTLVCNVLNAIGGHPVIDKPGFIPTYPGPLPGGVQSGLTVHLRPFSMEQLATYLDIEEPADQFHFKALALESAEPITIGTFYHQIIETLVALDQQSPPGVTWDGGRQVDGSLMYGAIPVSSLADAVKALTIIVEQGEGTRTTPVEVDGTDYAHFYRFQQIQKGRELEKVPGPPSPDPDDGWTFSGPAIPFDPEGVYPAPSDPAQAHYAGRAKLENDNFNYAYTSLLKMLHTLFNGGATDENFRLAITLMMSLKGQARAMMSGIPNPDPVFGYIVGPSFEYCPENPGF
jgi:hypothetical protein